MFFCFYFFNLLNYLKPFKCKVFQIIRCLIKPLLENSFQTIFQGGTSWVAQLLNNMNVWMVLYCAQQLLGLKKNRSSGGTDQSAFHSATRFLASMRCPQSWRSEPPAQPHHCWARRSSSPGKQHSGHDVHQGTNSRSGWPQSAWPRSCRAGHPWARPRIWQCRRRSTHCQDNVGLGEPSAHRW